MKQILKSSKDRISSLALRGSLTIFLFSGFVTAFSYAVYDSDLAVSKWPWKISMIAAILCCSVLLGVLFKYRHTDLLMANGIMGFSAFSSIYYFFGIVGYFYFFGFASIPYYMRWLGFSIGGFLNIYYIIISYRGVTLTIRNTAFVKKAFVENDENIVYSISHGIRWLDKYYNEPPFVPKIYLYVISILGPFAVILPRIISSSFGDIGVPFFMTIFCLPASLYVVEKLVQIYLIMILLPLKLKKERNKSVIMVD